MALPKLGKSSTEEEMHYSVGALIEENNKYLLIERVKIPFGYAGPAGHIDEGEKPLIALKREVNEEVGLDILTSELLFEEEIPWNNCSAGINCHYWYLYKCSTNGKVSIEKEEAKSFIWAPKHKLLDLELEPVWKYWFKKLRII